jgi:hypothetical protein
VNWQEGSVCLLVCEHLCLRARELCVYRHVWCVVRLVCLLCMCPEGGRVSVHHENYD